MSSEFGIENYERLGEISEQLLSEAQALERDAAAAMAAAIELDEFVKALAVPVVEQDFVAPIGTDEFPPEAWYVSVLHDPEGVGINSGWYATRGHTGCDFNIDRWPWGDVDRGAPVWAVTDGRVHSMGSSDGWLGVVVVEHDVGDGLLYARYAHLDEDRMQVVNGEEVKAGRLLGYLGDYQRGDTGDHLHWDTAEDPFLWWQWLTKSVRWINSRIVLEEWLGVEFVKRMFGRGDG